MLEDLYSSKLVKFIMLSCCESEQEVEEEAKMLQTEQTINIPEIELNSF